MPVPTQPKKNILRGGALFFFSWFVDSYLMLICPLYLPGPYLFLILVRNPWPFPLKKPYFHPPPPPTSNTKTEFPCALFPCPTSPGNTILIYVLSSFIRFSFFLFLLVPILSFEYLHFLQAVSVNEGIYKSSYCTMSWLSGPGAVTFRQIFNV
jgi:hypothetical protein